MLVNIRLFSNTSFCTLQRGAAYFPASLPEDIETIPKRFAFGFRRVKLPVCDARAAHNLTAAAQ